MDVPEARSTCDDILQTVADAVVADDSFLQTVLTAVLAEGHVLIEDVPGTGKTLTARSFADALGLSFARVQFTPDLLPADITGTHIYREADDAFEFQPGPIFANFVLADEINRAPPKTQAALLEAMAEGQVTVDGDTHALPEPFVVVATQNPVESEGVFPLPAAQKDRFLVKTAMGYPDAADEQGLLRARTERESPTPSADTALDPDGVLALQAVPERVTSSASSSRVRPTMPTMSTTCSATSSTSSGGPARTPASRSVSRPGGASGCSKRPGPGRSLRAGRTFARST